MSLLELDIVSLLYCVLTCIHLVSFNITKCVLKLSLSCPHLLCILTSRCVSAIAAPGIGCRLQQGKEPESGRELLGAGRERLRAVERC